MPSALRHTTDALLSEIMRHRGQKRRLRERLRFADVGDETETLDRERRSRVIRRTMAELHRFVRIELLRHRELLARPELERLEVADIVEEAILRALATVDERPSDVPFDRWLLSCAYDVLVEREEEVDDRVGRSLDEVVDGDPDDADLGTSPRRSPGDRGASSSPTPSRARRTTTRATPIGPCTTP